MTNKRDDVIQIDSVEKCSPVAYPIQSANTLFRFFKKADYLFGTLEKSAMIPRYYVETIDYLDVQMKHVAYPMICFCDINLHKMSEHIGFYGAYGIAFSKEWGMNKGIQPIQYVNKNSPLCKNFAEAFDYAINSDSEDAAQNFLLSQMYYFKPVYGTMQRDGEETPRIFTDECEWRYIPDLSSLNLPQAVSEQDIQSINTLNKTLDLSNESWLNFNYDEIKYIIVENEDAFKKLCELFERKIEIPELKNRLISRVIIWENEKEDF